MGQINYLRHFRLEIPVQFPCHGVETSTRDRVVLSAENDRQEGHWTSMFAAFQHALDGSRPPGLYYAPGGGWEYTRKVAEFGGMAIAGTITFDHTGLSDGRSRVRVFWDDVLLEEMTIEAIGYDAANQARRYVRAYVISDPTYYETGERGMDIPHYVESVRVGKLAGNVYSAPDAEGNSHSRGSRKQDWDEWWAWHGYTIPDIAATENYIRAHRGVWGAVCYPSRFFRCQDGWVWADPDYLNDARQVQAYIQVAVLGEVTGGSAISAVTDRAYRTTIAYGNDAGSQILCRAIERPDDRSTWGEERTVYTGSSCRHPSLAVYDDGSLTCWYMADTAAAGDDRQRASRSTDNGRTWTEISNMMGASLRNVAVCQHHGITLGVGIDTLNQLCLVRSNDQGASQSGIPGGGATQAIASSDINPDCRPDILWYPDGSVAVWAEDAAGLQICYTNQNSGYGSWSKVD